jgi:hypothetical protein
MATQVQFRRGTTSQNNAFTGAQGELTIDTEVYTIRIHDGTTAGGKQVPTLTATQTFTNKTMGNNSVWNGTAIGLGYGGTGAALSGVAGAVVYSTGSAMALSLAGTSGQVLTSGGTSGPTWVSASSLSTGTATTATTATNIAGGSAGYLVYQSDTNTTAFITPGDSGFVLRSTGASTAPEWVTSGFTLGSTAVTLGGTSTSLAGVRSITMGNGSHGGGTVGSTITGTGPWTATITGISSTTGIMVGQNITATAGTGSLFGGSPTSVLVASIVSGTSITVTVTGGTIPTAGTITSITTFGFLQVPSGTTAQRPWVPVAGMIRYNSTQTVFEGYSSGAWSSLGGVKSVDAFTYIQAETSAGASNGDLDFYAENAGGDAATQIGQWNRTNLKDYTGTLVGTQTTQNVFNATATTVNAFGAATALNIGNATSATLTLRPGTVVGSNTTQNLYNTVATTLNLGGAATTISIGAATGTLTVANTTLAANAITASTTLGVTGITTLTGALNANGGIAVDTTAFTVADTTGNTAIAGTLTVTGATVLNGGLTMDTDKFTVADTTGNTAIGGTLAVTGDQTNTGDLAVNGGDITTNQTTFNLINTTATTLNVGQAATTLSLGAATGTGYINNAAVTFGNATAFAINGVSPTLSSSSTGTLTLFNTNLTTVNAFGAATTVSIGAATGTLTINNAEVVISGNLSVNGTTTTINSTTLTVDDKNIELGSVGTPSDTTADGGGITLKGATDKTLNWVNATDAWTSSENIALAAGKTLLVGGSSSGTTTVTASAAASGTLTLPAATDTLVGKATTDTLTNKSISLTNNTVTFTSLELKTGCSDETGSGALVFATSPTLVTPTIGVATATSVNKVAFTAPATGSTLTIADGKTLTASNSLTFTGTDASSVAFGAGGTVLYSGGALGTPSSGTLTNCTFPTLNQNTTGSAATLTTSRTIAITGDLTYTSGSFDGSANVTGTGTLATVNSTTGAFGSSTLIPVVNVNAKGLVTSVTTAAVQGGQYFGAAATKAISYNSNSIGENITITTGNNGLSAGPVTIADGYTVTIADGSVWTIV